MDARREMVIEVRVEDLKECIKALRQRALLDKYAFGCEMFESLRDVELANKLEGMLP